MAEEAIDYEAQYQARQEAFTRQRHADLLAAQRNAPEPVDDATPTPTDVGEGNDDPEKYYKERTQARLAARRQKSGGADAASGGTSATNPFMAAGGSQDDVKDLMLLAFAIAGFWAVWPPVSLWASYHLRLIGGKPSGARFLGAGLFTDALGFLNEFCENAVLPGAKGATKGAMGVAGQAAGGASAVEKNMKNSLQDMAGGNMSGLNPGQLLLLFFADIVVGFGLLTCSAFFLTIVLGTSVLGGAIGWFCSSFPDLCITIAGAIIN